MSSPLSLSVLLCKMRIIIASAHKDLFRALSRPSTAPSTTEPPCSPWPVQLSPFQPLASGFWASTLPLSHSPSPLPGDSTALGYFLRVSLSPGLKRRSSCLPSEVAGIIGVYHMTLRSPTYRPPTSSPFPEALFLGQSVHSCLIFTTMRPRHPSSTQARPLLY